MNRSNVGGWTKDAPDTETKNEKPGTKICPQCGSEIDTDVKYCTQCGERQK